MLPSPQQCVECMCPLKHYRNALCIKQTASSVLTLEKPKSECKMYFLSPHNGALTPAGIHLLSVTNKQNQKQELPQRKPELGL